MIYLYVWWAILHCKMIVLSATSPSYMEVIYTTIGVRLFEVARYGVGSLSCIEVIQTITVMDCLDRG